ncbi:MAG: ParA family protein [Microthrixaceae bacterium]
MAQSLEGVYLIPQCIAFVAGKGGVLKTTAATQTAGLAAAGGWSVLLVDLDPQGNAMFDLGYRSDGGAGLADALMRGTPLRPASDRRDGLAYVAGGPALDELAPHLALHPEAIHALHNALEPIADAYDLIVVDAPPRELALRRMILTAAHYLVVPSGVDRASRVGLADAAASVTEIRQATNPDLDVLGVFAGPVGANSHQIRARVVTRLGDLIDDHDLVLGTVVRYAPLIAEECRERGLLVGEYADAASRAQPWYEAIKTGSETYSRAAEGLAADWQLLVDEILARFVKLQEPS